MGSLLLERALALGVMAGKDFTRLKEGIPVMSVSRAVSRGATAHNFSTAS